jgi:glycosyltransferase involved in cell wall biosynthesis
MPTVTIVSVGDPRLPETWSGVTTGVCNGLEQIGVEVKGMSVGLPRPLELALLAAASLPTVNRYDARGARLTAAVRSLLARRLGTADRQAVIQTGSEFILPQGSTFVTLEDMTLRQAAAVHPSFRRVSPRVFGQWERRRAETYKRATMCAVASRWAADSLHSDYGVPRERIAVVGFGATHRAQASNRDWDTPRFLFVGIEWERKGGPRVLRAFEEVRRKYPDATLDVVGGHPSISQAGVRAHGVLRHDPAERDRMAQLFAQATCLVMPSVVEPFGIVHVEAGYAGLPSIGSSIGGPADVLRDGGGAVVGPDDDEGLLAAMLRLCDPNEAATMGAIVQERSRLFTWELVAERLLRALGVAAPQGRQLAEFL